jgi:chemotaxis protein methyltransferase CheR
METSLEEIELDLLLEGLVRRYGYDFRNYARASLRRRVHKAMTNESVSTISALQDRVLRDLHAMHRFVTALSVHVTAMFRDPEFYLAMRRKVIPMLRTYPFVRIWHAGCATGEEVYSLAIVLQEEGMYDRCRIYATDLSDDLLVRARRGIFPLENMRKYTQNYIKSGGLGDFSQYYVADHKNAVVRENLRRNVIFSQHNLVSDASFNEFHLILCRNVLIYFDRVLRDRVHDLLYQSLTMFGVLGLGMKESLEYTPHVHAFEPMAPEVRLYRRTR